ncbi:hypothetical protein VARV_IND64_vel4_051 [Variola virus]|uniref:C7L protein n=1 Tax=Variola virus TaxID=10255 RepID=Q85374_VARV|nr:homolog of vaccinia virus CDS HindIII E ORF C; putative [Variola major virus]ABF22811.1 hypothetical protein VARV_BEN68_59_051 [Variola virus]CAB54648.1 C7L protein [Variola minor virus]ABF23014.1 hypothetical protein VARV_BOT72_143_051 [Variola virus]ABF23216.1 hypothetical protein VARV_BOT73_225_051 [Variola virus]
MLHEFHTWRLLKFRVESCSSIHLLSLHPLYVIMSPMDIIGFNKYFRYRNKILFVDVFDYHLLCFWRTFLCMIFTNP